LQIELETIKKLKPKLKGTGTPSGTPGKLTSDVKTPEKGNSALKPVEAVNISGVKQAYQLEISSPVKQAPQATHQEASSMCSCCQQKPISKRMMALPHLKTRGKPSWVCGLDGIDYREPAAFDYI
jgi:hypothetical protein